MSSFVPTGGGGVEDTITLSMADLLKGSFEKNIMFFLINLLQQHGEMSLTELKKKLDKEYLTSLSPSKRQKIVDAAETIIFLHNNYNTEFIISNFLGIFLEPVKHTVYSLGHGNIHTVYYSDADMDVLAKLYPNNLQERIDSLSTISITNETAAGCTSMHYRDFSRQLENIGKVGEKFSKKKKLSLRENMKTKLEDYLKIIGNKIELLEERSLDPDREDIEKTKSLLTEYKLTQKDIEKILAPNPEGTPKTLRTYNKESLTILNAQVANKKMEDTGDIQNFGIIYMPELKDDSISPMFDEFCKKYITAKLTAFDQDSHYYKLMLRSTHRPDDPNTDIQILFEHMIKSRNMYGDYAFCIYKRPGAKFGSLAYEIVKQYVRQSKNDALKILFYANFCIDNIAYKTSEITNPVALKMRSVNNDEKLVEILSLLEIMSCCGPHLFVNSSCLNTAVEEQEVNEALNPYMINTQSTNNSQNPYADLDYVPGSQPLNYEIVSGVYPPSVDTRGTTFGYSPKQPLTLEDLDTSHIEKPQSRSRSRSRSSNRTHRRSKSDEGHRWSSNKRNPGRGFGGSRKRGFGESRKRKYTYKI